mmetsp:Transcript_14211/g.40785  ORF Transcript_14211/g.40785 Transcript_14211/m.40785 type:complete len:399 (-) Transcript_14211:125-1321(-)
MRLDSRESKACTSMIPQPWNLRTTRSTSTMTSSTCQLQPRPRARACPERPPPAAAAAPAVPTRPTAPPRPTRPRLLRWSLPGPGSGSGPGPVERPVGRPRPRGGSGRRSALAAKAAIRPQPQPQPHRHRTPTIGPRWSTRRRPPRSLPPTRPSSVRWEFWTARRPVTSYSSTRMAAAGRLPVLLPEAAPPVDLAVSIRIRIRIAAVGRRPARGAGAVVAMAADSGAAAAARPGGPPGTSWTGPDRRRGPALTTTAATAPASGAAAREGASWPRRRRRRSRPGNGRGRRRSWKVSTSITGTATPPPALARTVRRRPLLRGVPRGRPTLMPPPIGLRRHLLLGTSIISICSSSSTKPCTSRVAVLLLHSTRRTMLPGGRHLPPLHYPLHKVMAKAKAKAN